MSHISSLTLWSSIKVPRALSVSLQQKRSNPLVDSDDKLDNSSFNNLKWKKDMFSLPENEKNSSTTQKSFECVEPYNKVIDSYSPLEYLSSPITQPSTSQKLPKRRKKKISFVTIPEIYVIDDNVEEEGGKEKGFWNSDPYGVGSDDTLLLKDFGVGPNLWGGRRSNSFAADSSYPYSSVSGLDHFLPHHGKEPLPPEDMYEEDKEKYTWYDWNSEESYNQRSKRLDEDETPLIKPWKIDELEEINTRYKRLENKIKKTAQRKIKKNKYKFSKPLRKISPTNKNNKSTNLSKNTANEVDSDIDGNEVFYDCETSNSGAELGSDKNTEKEPRKKIIPADENYYEAKLAQLYKLKLGIKS